MVYQISPGVNVREIDLTTVVPGASSSIGGFVGVFRWGPLNEIMVINSELDLVKRCGQPDVETSTSFFSAANFLGYGSQLRCVRVADTTSTISVERGIEITVDIAVSDTTVNGAGFLTGLAKVKVGDEMEITYDVAGTPTTLSTTVTAVNSDTEIEVADAFLEDVVAELASFTILNVPNGAVNATAEDSTGSDADGIGLLVSNDSVYDLNYADGQGDVGMWVAKYPGVMGNSIRVSVCDSKDSFSRTSSIVNAAGSATITGTNFDLHLVVGSIVKSAAGEERTVVSVTNATTAELNVGFTGGFTGVAQIRWQYANLFGIEPGTSGFAEFRGGSKDEMHVVVIDELGLISGVKGGLLEKYDFVSKAADAKTEDGASNYYKNKINGASQFIRWMSHNDNSTNWGHNALNTEFSELTKPYSVNLKGGRDNNVGNALTISSAKMIGFDEFKSADLVDVSLLIMGEADSSVASYVINNIAEERKDCVVFISPRMADVVDNVGNEVRDILAYRAALPSTSYAVMDSGWKLQYDKYNDVRRWVPLNADIAGLCARTDHTNDPWYSPAGYIRGNIKNVLRLAFNPNKANRDDLYVMGINAVTSEVGQGTILYGDKTLLDRPSAFDRINVRRLFIALQKSISKAAKYSLFEFNDQFTRQNFVSLVEPFLRDVQGRRGIYDFRVVCDATNNTPEVIDRNEFVGDIYLSPSKSINYIRLSFVAVRTGVEFSTVVGSF